MHVKFCGLIFCVFGQENLWESIVVGFAKHASYCGLIFVDIIGIPPNPQKFILLKNFFPYSNNITYSMRC